ncbi:MAG: ABC transporter substrate-binding protein [Bacteroidales bacterium]|nr:ABC transporter substrate-binding protein [Bacteroidales bacterium]
MKNFSTEQYNKPVYAKGYEYFKFGGITHIRIFNPWQKAENVMLNYAIIDADNENIKLPDDYFVIKKPINRLVCLSTTHIGFLSAIDELDKVVGMSGSQYVNNSFLAKQVLTKQVKEVGYEQSLNYEMIIHLKPDIIFAYSVGNENIGYFRKFQEIGIPVLYIAEYLEDDPLGKLEWIKVVAELFDKRDMAFQYFSDVEKKYLMLKQIGSEVEQRPNVLVGLPWKGTWFVPGGNSYLANLIKDAGANYLWSDLISNKSEPMSLESVFQKGQLASYWINCGSADSVNQILGVDERIKDFPVFKSGNIYNHNARINEFGGMDYWESGVINPHIILNDLIKIFHPELNTGHKLFYYKKLK